MPHLRLQTREEMSSEYSCIVNRIYDLTTKQGVMDHYDGRDIIKQAFHCLIAREELLSQNH